MIKYQELTKEQIELAQKLHSEDKIGIKRIAKIVKTSQHRIVKAFKTRSFKESVEQF